MKSGVEHPWQRKFLGYTVCNREYKRPFTRAKNLMRLGLDEKRAWNSAQNGRASWQNAGTSDLNQALPKKLFDRFGLVSLMGYYHQLIRFT